MFIFSKISSTVSKSQFEMLKCVLRYTSLFKPCNPQTIPLMLSRHYNLRRRGSFEHAELDDKFDTDNKDRTREEKNNFKGI